jgi:protein O-mannosyl-transferase
MIKDPFFSIKNKIICSLFVLWVVTGVTFSPSLKGDLATWDDDALISDNSLVTNLSPQKVVKIFKSDVLKTYIPLTLLTFAVENHFVGEKPFLYHFDNLLLHMAVVSLIFLLAIRIGLPLRAAFLAAIVFAIHPMHVEAVAWASSRKDVLYSLFYLLALYSYWVYIDQGRKMFFILSLAFGVLSIFSKAMALSLPLVLFLFDRIKGRRLTLKVIAEKVPYFFYIVPIAWITYQLNAGLPESGEAPGILTWVWTLIFYVRQFFFPVTLLPVYKLPEPIALNSPSYMGALFFIGLIGFAIFRWRKKPLVIFSFFYFFLSIFFLLRVDPAKTGINPVADRFMYLPSMGFCLLIGFYADIWFERLRKREVARAYVAQIFCMLLILGLSIKSFNQCRIWNNDFALWTYAVQKDANNDYAHFGVGQAYYEKGDHQKAWEHYLKTIELNPTHAKAHNNIGEMLYQAGERQEAMVHFEKAFLYLPDYPEARNNYGIILSDLGQYDLAKRFISEAASMKPEVMDYKISLGDVYLTEGDKKTAREIYEEVLLHDPQNAFVFNRLGVLALQENSIDEAIGYFQRAVKIDPEYKEAQFNFGLAVKIQRGMLEHK